MVLAARPQTDLESHNHATAKVRLGDQALRSAIDPGRNICRSAGRVRVQQSEGKPSRRRRLLAGAVDLRRDCREWRGRVPSDFRVRQAQRGLKGDVSGAVLVP